MNKHITTNANCAAQSEFIREYQASVTWCSVQYGLICRLLSKQYSHSRSKLESYK